MERRGGLTERRGLGRGVLLPLLIALLGMAVFVHSARVEPYHGDEGDYIWTSRYFGLIALRGDLSGPEWQDGHWTHTQPMLMRYLLGAWLWARGYDIFAFRTPEYDFLASLETNRLAGRVPPDRLIADARLPSVLLATAAVTLLYLLGTTLAGPLAGGTASLLALASPLVRAHLVRATPESLLLALLLLTLLLAVRGLRRPTGEIPTGWAVAIGITLGLALQTKLTASLALAALILWVLLVTIVALRRSDGSFTRVWNASRGWLLALALAAAVFVATNPHLYPNPVEHTAHLFERRAEEMEIQRGLPQPAVGGVLDRARYVVGGSLVLQPVRPDGDSTAWRGIPLGVVLAPIGALLLLVRARHDWRDRRAVAPAGLLLLVTGVIFVGTTAGIHLYWTRYLVPTALLGNLLSGVGLAGTVGTILERLRGRVLRGSPGVHPHGGDESAPLPRPRG